jgi:hypothetical protein
LRRLPFQSLCRIVGHTYSRRLALVFGLLLPVAETVRRWHQISAGTHILFWLDDVLLGSLRKLPPA